MLATADSNADPTLRFGLSEALYKHTDAEILKSHFNFEIPNMKIILYADKQDLDSSKDVFD